MPDQPTEKSRYKSPSSEGYVTCAQYIAEIMCNRMAEKENVGSQAHKFWNLPKWRKHFQYQVILANRLVKKYTESAIVKAIHSPECSRMYSLRYPPLESIIQKYEKIIERQAENSTTIEVREDATRRQRGYGKKTNLQRLRDIDGKKESN